MAEKPTYEELEQRVKEFEEEAINRKRVEEELRIYECIVATANEHMAFIDKNYIYKAVNDTYLKAHKKRREEIVGHSIVELFGQEMFTKKLKPHADRCLAGEEVHYQLWIDYPGFGRRCIDIANYPFFEEDKTISGFIVNSRDITDRKRTEDALQKAHDELEERVEERTAKLTTVNEQLTRVEEEFNALMESCELFYGLENLNLHKDGRTVLLETSGVPIIDANGKLQGYRGVDRDITERKQAEEALKEYSERLEDMVEERTRELREAQDELVKHERLSVLGQLTATVSHELRNPLGVIQSSAFYVESKLSDVDVKIIKHLKRIKEQVGLCDSIVGDLLEYTQGRLSEKFKGDLHTWLEAVLDQTTIPEQVSQVRELYLGLPMVSFDRDRLQRVVINHQGPRHRIGACHCEKDR
jgi:PAS domain S-box-containing protein